MTGLVLVDATHEDALAADRVAQLEHALTCLKAAEESSTEPRCAYRTSSINGEIGAKLAAAQAQQVAQPTYWRARASELESLETSATQLRTMRKPFGTMPVEQVAQADAATVVAAVLRVLDKQN